LEAEAPRKRLNYKNLGAAHPLPYPHFYPYLWPLGPVCYIQVQFTLPIITVSNMTAPLPSSSSLPMWIIDAATLASLLGLALTIYVAITLEQVRRRYARKGRLPKIYDELERATSALLAFLNELPDGEINDQNAASLAAQALKPHVLDAVNYTSSNVKLSAQGLHDNLSDMIELARTTGITASQLWSCYGSAKELNSMLNSSLLDDAWRA